MFDQTFVNTSAQTRRPWTVAASLVIQTLMVIVLFVAPLLRVAVLRKPETLPISLSHPSPNHAVRTEIRTAAHSAAANRPVFPADSLRPAATVPRHVDLAPDAPQLITDPPTPGGTAEASIFAMLSQVPASAPVRITGPAKPQQPAAPSVPVHVSAGVQSAKLIFAPSPAYPPLAKATRTTGTVRIQAIIGPDGAIRDLQVLSGHPLLIEAAKKAVERWRYQATLLNGVPVEVITEIDVNFIMGQ